MLWLVPATALVALALAAYGTSDVSRRGTLAAISLVSVLLALFFRPAAIAVLLGIAPILDGVAAWVLRGNPAFHDTISPSWAEPAFLGICLGLLFRAYGREHDATPGPPATVFYAAAAAAALAVPLAGLLREWGSQTPVLLRMMWRWIPFMDQSRPDHVLRAGLLQLAGVLWFMLARRALATPGQVRSAAWGWLAGAVLAAVYGTVMWARGEGHVPPRVESTLTDPNSFGSFMLLSSFLAAALVVSESDGRRRSLASLALPVTAWGLLLSGSRMALLAAGVGAVAVVLGAPRRRAMRLATMAATVALLLVAVLLAVSLHRRPQPYPLQPYLLRSLAQAGDPLFLAAYFREQRVAIWQATGRALLDQPLFGIGPGTLYRSIARYYTPFDHGMKPVNENAHNYFLQLGAESGILTLAGFGWLIWSVLRAGRNRDTPPVRALVAGVGAYLLTALTGHPLILVHQVVLFWGFLALLAAWRAHGGPEPPPFPSAVARWSPLIVVVALVVVITRQGTTSACTGTAAAGSPFQEGFFHEELVATGQTWHEGFFDARWAPATEPWRWMGAAGRLLVCDGSGTGAVTLRAQSFAESRRVGVFSAGRKVAEIVVTPAPGEFTVPVDAGAAGTRDLILVPMPGARRIDDILHNGDRRAVTLRVAEPIPVTAWTR